MLENRFYIIGLGLNMFLRSVQKVEVAPLRKGFAMGNSDFKQIISQGLYFDKSLLIKEIIDNPITTNLFIFPRRFGKTTNLYMLYEFFNINEDPKCLFQDLKIWDISDGYYQKYAGSCPIVFLTLKDIKGSNFEEFKASMLYLIREHYVRYKPIIFPSLSEKEKVFYRDIIDHSEKKLKKSLKNLIAFISRYYGKSVLLLIDEYDKPIEAGCIASYFPETISFLKDFLSSVLENNPFIFKAVLTGVLNTDELFGKLSDFKCYSLLSKKYRRYFGVTDKELNNFILTLKLSDSSAELQKKLQEFYGGYQVDSEVGLYNPWSVLNFWNNYFYDPTGYNFKFYWSNIGANEWFTNLLFIKFFSYSIEAKKNLKTLVSGLPILSKLTKQINYFDFLADSLVKDQKSIWSLLFFMGYMSIKRVTDIDLDSKEKCYEFVIPNKEILTFFYKILVEIDIEEERISTENKKLHPTFFKVDSENLKKRARLVIRELVKLDDYESLTKMTEALANNSWEDVERLLREFMEVSLSIPFGFK